MSHRDQVIDACAKENLYFTYQTISGSWKGAWLFWEAEESRITHPHRARNGAVHLCSACEELRRNSKVATRPVSVLHESASAGCTMCKSVANSILLYRDTESLYIQRLPTLQQFRQRPLVRWRGIRKKAPLEGLNLLVQMDSSSPHCLLKVIFTPSGLQSGVIDSFNILPGKFDVSEALHTRTEGANFMSVFL